MAASAFSINYYLTELFDVSMFVYIRENIWMFITIVAIELVALFGISFLVSFLFVRSLNKKI
jgi:hypothetical protein